VFTSELPFDAAAALAVIAAVLGKLVTRMPPSNGIPFKTLVNEFTAPPTLPIGVASELISGASGEVKPV